LIDVLGIGRVFVYPSRVSRDVPKDGVAFLSEGIIDFDNPQALHVSRLAQY